MTLVHRLAGKLHYLPVIIVSTYALFIALILHPQIQAHNVFLHGFNIPFHFDISKPEEIKTLPSGKVRNFQVEAIDGVLISGWHLLPEDVKMNSVRGSFDEALQQRPTLIYFHGNAMNRAAPFRIEAYAMFTSLGVNVVAIDYRGFGDSQGTPSEEGLQRDARATYKWIRQRQLSGSSVGENSPAIYIAGQSLGTGVAARLALDLYRVGEAPSSLFLIAPYTSIRNLLTSYKIGGFFPLFWPLGLLKVLSDLADKHLYTRFESEKVLYQLTRRGDLKLDELKQWGNLDYTIAEAALAEELGLPSFSDNRSKETVPPNIIISHADDDAVIPHAHGRSLLDTIASAQRRGGNDTSIQDREYHWGSTHTLLDGQGHRSYVLVKSHKGGHNSIPKHALHIFSTIAGLKSVEEHR